MTLRFYTAKPAALLAKFNDRIEQDEAKDGIDTWVKNEKGDFTHKAPNWNKLAWFQASVDTDCLRFELKSGEKKPFTVLTYAYYHGHLTQAFLTHFHSDFTRSEASPPKVATTKPKPLILSVPKKP